MAKSQRNSNVELLRIISMFAIICGHFVGQSGDFIFNNSVNDFLLIFISSGSRIAVNVFLLIGVWYMVDSKFSSKRILKLYLQVYFYTSIITIIMLIVTKANLPIKETVYGFVPFLGRCVWFASAYIFLLLFKPFLDKILNWNKKELLVFIIMFLFLMSFVSTILSNNATGFLCDTIWFGAVYLLIGFIKKYPPKLKINKNTLFFIGWGGYSILAIIKYYVSVTDDKNLIYKILDRAVGFYQGDIKTVPNFLIAFCIFYWVINLRERHSKIINFMSASTFSVYIIHQVPVFYPFMWANIFMAEKWLPEHSVIYALIVTVIVFVACSLIDFPRRKFIEPAVSKSKPFRWAEKKIDNIFNQINVGG